jgi:pantoate--beta-alanine ligase
MITTDNLGSVRRVQGRRGVVMTMGALHEGHLALVRAARAACEEVMVTIFVNRLQFDDPGDLARYPRTLEADAALLAPHGVDVLYVPTEDQIYPGGEPVVTVASGRLGEVFEGEFRPGHFDGMLTVVLKLLNLTAANVAYFGEKDAQQLIAIKRMVADFNLPVTIASVPTVRAEDGLALSSRNAQLEGADRQAALALSRSLRAVVSALAIGTPLTAAITGERLALSHVRGVTVDYLAALDPATAEPLGDDHRGMALIAGAIRVGNVRLIDNVTTPVVN